VDEEGGMALRASGPALYDDFAGVNLLASVSRRHSANQWGKYQASSLRGGGLGWAGARHGPFFLYCSLLLLLLMFYYADRFHHGLPA